MPDVTPSTPTDAAPIVLVVDDVALVREMVRAALRCQGFEVRQAGDGREAIELYRREHQTIAIVLLDVQMPGLDGPAVLTAFHTIDPSVRAFFMTGDVGRYSEDGLLAMGARRVFAKPLNLAAGAAELRLALSGADSGSLAAGGRGDPLPLTVEKGLLS